MSRYTPGRLQKQKTHAHRAGDEQTCAHCKGVVRGRAGAARAHLALCKAASPEAREYFRQFGRWPRGGGSYSCPTR